MLSNYFMAESEKEQLIKFAEDGSPHLRCPVCGKIYREPVINVQCGHTFCRKCADSLSVCPVDEAICLKEQLVINRLVVGQVDDLKIHCRHGILLKDGELVLDPTGCSEIIILGQRREHENICQFAMVDCPYSSYCGLFRRSAVDKHSSVCKFAPNILAASVAGTKVHSPSIAKECGCELHQAEVSQLKNTVNTLQRSIAAFKTQVESLSQKVYKLEQFRTDTLSRLEKQNSTVSSLQKQYENMVTQIQQLGSGGNHRISVTSTSSMADIHGGTQMRGLQLFPGQSSPNVVEKWEMPFQFKCIGTLRGHQDVVWCMTAYRGRLYSAGSDKLIKVWNVDQLAKGCMDNFAGHTDRIHAMVRKGNKLYTGGADTSIRCWDTEKGTQVEIVEAAHDNIICAMAVAGDYLFTSSFSLIKAWDINKLTLVNSFSGLHHWVRALAVSPNKDRLYSGSHNAIDVWETFGSFQSLGKIDHECGSVYSLVITKMFIIAGTYNRNIQVFSATTHEFVTKLSSHIGTVSALVPSLSGHYLFSASHDSNIFVWNLDTFLPIQNLSRHQGNVNALTLCGNMVFSGAEDHEIKVFRYLSLQ